MSLAAAMRKVRARVESGEQLFAALFAEVSGLEVLRAEALLVSVFIPAANEYARATQRYAEDPSDANGVEVISLAARPECRVQFWDWVESKDRQSWDILRGLDVAILRAKRLG